MRKDVIIGAPYESNSDNNDGPSGALYIYLGSAEGLKSNPHKVFEKTDSISSIIFI